MSVVLLKEVLSGFVHINTATVFIREAEAKGKSAKVIVNNLNKNAEVVTCKPSGRNSAVVHMLAVCTRFCTNYIGITLFGEFLEYVFFKCSFPSKSINTALKNTHTHTHKRHIPILAKKKNKLFSQFSEMF